MNILAAYMVPHPPLIIPEVRKGQEKEIQATIDGYQEVANEIKRMNPDTIVIVTPHNIMYADYFHISPGDHVRGDFSEFRAPKVSFDIGYDQKFTDKLTTLSEKNGISAGFLGERDPALDHGTMVPLYFIRQAFSENFHNKIVRMYSVMRLRYYLRQTLM